MNVWMRRSVGVAVIAAGLVAAGSTAAQAYDFGPTGGSGFQLPTYSNYQNGNVTSGPATNTVTNTGAFTNTTPVTTTNSGGSPSSVGASYGSNNYAASVATGHGNYQDVQFP